MQVVAIPFTERPSCTASLARGAAAAVVRRRNLFLRLRPRRRADGEGPGARLLPHDARRLRGHRAVRRHGRAAGRPSCSPTPRPARSTRRWRALTSRPRSRPRSTRYLINTGAKLVLVDTGAGGLFGPDARQARREPQGVRLPARQVDEIYITHMHADHVGGLVAGGNSRSPTPSCAPTSATPTSGSARPTWTRRPGRRRASSRARMASLNPYVKAGKFKPFDGDHRARARHPGVAARPHARPQSTWSRARARS